MIEFLEHKNIDKTTWNEALSKSVNPLIYAHSWYLDIVCPGWAAIVIDEYKAIFPIPFNEKMGIKYIYPPYFIQQLGLFYMDKKYNSEFYYFSIFELLKNKYKFIELYANEKNNPPAFKDIKLSSRQNYLLDLNKSYDSIFKNYSNGLKGRVKKSKKSEVIIHDSQDPERLIDLFKREKGTELNKLHNKEYSILHKLTKTALKLNQARIKLAYIDNRLLAGAIFLYYKNRITYLFSATSHEGKKYSAMSLILDEVIHEYSGKDFILDFEGSMVESIASYFKSFGSSESLYLQLKLNRLPKMIRWLKQ